MPETLQMPVVFEVNATCKPDDVVAVKATVALVVGDVIALKEILCVCFATSEPDSATFANENSSINPLK